LLGNDGGLLYLGFKLGRQNRLVSTEERLPHTYRVGKGREARRKGSSEPEAGMVWSEFGSVKEEPSSTEENRFLSKRGRKKNAVPKKTNGGGSRTARGMV